MISYPDTELYVVQYHPATSGKFVTAMLASLLYNRNYTIKLSKFGNAHDISTTRNFTRKDIDDLDLKIINPSLPIVVPTHSSFEYTDIACKFPKLKIIRIHATFPDDYLLLYTNQYFKVYCENFQWPLPHANWEYESKTFLSGAKNPQDEIITDSMIMDLISYWISKGEKPNFKPYLPNDNIIVLPLAQLGNKLEFFKTMSNVTGRSITGYQETLYDQYIKAQEPINNFIDKYNQKLQDNPRDGKAN